MTEPYLFERGIGQQMGDLCRLAVGEDKVTQTGEIVTLEDMLGRGAFGVSVEVPFTSGGVQSVSVTRCGKNLLNFAPFTPPWWLSYNRLTNEFIVNKDLKQNILLYIPLAVVIPPAQYALSVFVKQGNITGNFTQGTYLRNPNNWGVDYQFPCKTDMSGQVYTKSEVVTKSSNEYVFFNYDFSQSTDLIFKTCLSVGSVATEYEPYTGDTYTISLPADFYGGSIDLEAGTVTSRYAADGTELAAPVVTEIDPISIPILAGVNNIWADVGTVTVSYYAADAQAFRPALWYPTIYRGLTSARYLIKRASGAIASFSDGIAAPLVGLRVALPWRSEGYQSVSVTVNGTLTTISLPTTIYGGYLDVVTGQLVATHDENGNLLTNQKLYFLPPTNINALAGVNNVWSDAGDVAVSYRIDNG